MSPPAGHLGAFLYHRVQFETLQHCWLEEINCIIFSGMWQHHMSNAGRQLPCGCVRESSRRLMYEDARPGIPVEERREAEANQGAAQTLEYHAAAKADVVGP